MATAAAARRSRLSVDLTADERRRIRLAAAHRDQSIREYVLSAIEAQLARDREASDPALGALWDNPNDATYDKL